MLGLGPSLGAAPQTSAPSVGQPILLGAAYFTGIAAGIWTYPDDILRIHRIEREFEPSMNAAKRDELYDGWKRAVERAQRWA